MSNRLSLASRFVYLFFTCFLFVSNTRATDLTQPLKVGSELDFYPYAFVNEQGKADGFSVDLIVAVAEAMNLKLDIEPGPWGKVWGELVDKKIDILPLVGKLPERMEVVDFSATHTGTYDAFFTRSGESLLPDLASAAGKDLVVMDSDVAHHKLLEVKFQGKVTTVKTISEGIQMVAAGQHDAFLGPLPMGTLAIRDQHIKGITIGKPVPDYIRLQAFAVKKGDKELLDKLNEGLRIVKANGKYDEIYNKWLVFEDSSDQIWDYVLNGLYVAGGIFVLVCIAFLIIRKRRQPPVKA